MSDAPAPGFYPNVTREKYDSWNLPSYSFLKLFLKETPAKIQWMRYHAPEKISTAMQEGDWIDALLYDRDRLETDFIALPDDPPYARPSSRQINAANPGENTIKAIAWWADWDAKAGTRTPIKAELYNEAETIVETFYKHKVGKCLEHAPHKQVAVVWDDEQTGVRLKGLIDTIAPYDGWTNVIDVKTVGDSADEDNFGRRGTNLKYPMQAFMYTAGLNSVSPHNRRFMWIVMEREPPFQIATYDAKPGDETMQVGEHAFRKALGIYANCKETGLWPSYPTKPQPFKLPGWAKPRNDQ